MRTGVSPPRPPWKFSRIASARASAAGTSSFRGPPRRNRHAMATSRMSKHACRTSPAWASTSSTSRPSSRSDTSTARGRTTHSRRSPAMWGVLGPSAPRRAATRRSCGSSERSRISGAWWPRRAGSAWRLPSTSLSSAHPITPTCTRIPSGSSTAPTAACNTRKIRRRNTRISTPSISRPMTGALCGRSSRASSISGSIRGSAYFASTTRTPSRFRSGNG